MIIYDIDYLESIDETYTKHLNGGRAVVISEFSANAYGNLTDVSTALDNLVISYSGFNLTSSSVRVTSRASGDDAIASASAFSASSASSIDESV
ncbi:hypothetical protein NUACC26_077580 [Scytonema sp. NUACC26]